MTNNHRFKDLVVLVPDKNVESVIEGLLSRDQSLEIRQLSSNIYVHPQRDPGCLLLAHDFLRPFIRTHSHALVVFDCEGCGREHSSREALEEEVENLLSETGWENRASAVVIAPELKVWVWSDSPYVESVLGWEGSQPNLRTWLAQEGFLGAAQTKPNRPKEAVEQALRLASRPRSSSRYFELAQKVSLNRCIDSAFAKFKAVLKAWFAEEEPASQ